MSRPANPNQQPPQRIIGLTGGIATGKSTVANYMAQTYGIPVLDADVYARSAVQSGSPILERIVEHFGAEIQLSDGSLDRQQLGERIFKDAAERRWLEAQIHPTVCDRFQKALATLQDQPIVVLAVPLLFEAQMTDLVTEIWVVTCSQSQQIQRLQQRNNLSATQAQTRINAQMPLALKVAQATVVLDNSSSIEDLRSQVDRVLQGSNR